MENAPASPLPRIIFGRNLRLMRRLKDVSQEDLALSANLSRTYVSEVERGIRNISIDNMGLLADALGVGLKVLVDPDIKELLKDHIE